MRGERMSSQQSRVCAGKRLTDESHAAAQDKDAIQSSDFHKLIGFIPVMCMVDNDDKKWVHSLLANTAYYAHKHVDIKLKDDQCGSPSKTTTSPEQVHEGHTNEAVHIQDQVWFLIQQNKQTGKKRIMLFKKWSRSLFSKRC